MVNGWLDYYAVPTSFRYSCRFAYYLKRIWLRSLRRRSQKDRHRWVRLEQLSTRHWPTLEIRHPWPDQRFAVRAKRSTTRGRSRMPLRARPDLCGGSPAMGIPTAILRDRISTARAGRASGTDIYQCVGSPSRGQDRRGLFCEGCGRAKHASRQSDKGCDVDRSMADAGRVRQISAACRAGN